MSLYSLATGGEFEMSAFGGLDAITLLTNGGMLTRERESSRRFHSGSERNLAGCARTPNVTATNRERGRRKAETP